MADGDGAAIHVHPRRVPAKILVHRARLGGERLVRLDQIKVPGQPASPLQRLAAGRDRPGPHQRRIDPHGRKRCDARQRGKAATGCLRGRHHHQRTATIVQAAGVAGGHGAVLAEGRAQPGHRLGRRIMADILVLRHHRVTLAALDGDWDDLVGETPRLLRGARLALGAEGKLVLLLAGDLVGLGDVLRRGAHVIAVEGIPQPIPDHGVDQVEIAHLLALPQIGRVLGLAHAFLPARDHDLALARADLLGGQCHGAQARAAHLVDAERRLAVGNARRMGGLAGRVLPLAGRQHLAEDDLIDLARLQPGARNRLLDRGGAEDMCGHGAERAVETADRRTRRGNDDDVFHLALPCGSIARCF